MNASSTPIGNSEGATTLRAIASARRAERSAAERACREQCSRARAYDPARDVRHDEPDESHHPRQSHTGSGQERG